MNSRDMLNQQKQEIARSVPDPSPRRGWGLGTRLSAFQSLQFRRPLPFSPCYNIIIDSRSIILYIQHLQFDLS